MNMKNPQLPAGITDQNIEVYYNDGDLYCIQKGETMKYNDWPAEFKAAFELKLIQDPVAIDSLATDMGITDSGEMLKQYIICTQGGWDSIPDLTTDGAICPEYWDCGRHGECKSEGKVCKLPKGPGGSLGHRETQVVYYVAHGLPDKLIADKMGITINTVKTHLGRIRSKLHAYNRIDIMRFAIKYNLHK